VTWGELVAKKEVGNEREKSIIVKSPQSSLTLILMRYIYIYIKY